MAAGIDSRTRISDLATSYNGGICAENNNISVVLGGIFGSFFGAREALKIATTQGSLIFPKTGCAAGQSVDLYAFRNIRIKDGFHLVAFDKLTIATHELFVGALNIETPPTCQITLTCRTIHFLTGPTGELSEGQRFIKEHAPQGTRFTTTRS